MKTNKTGFVLGHALKLLASCKTYSQTLNMMNYSRELLIRGRMDDKDHALFTSQVDRKFKALRGE